MESSSEPPEERVGFEMATPAARIVARAVDLVMILAVATLIAAALAATGVIDADALGDSTSDPSVDTAVLLSFLGAALIYEVGWTSIRGKTLGKVITRSKLISTSNDGPPGLGAAIIRVAVWLIPVLLLNVIGLVMTAGIFGWALFDSNRQGLHDKMATTYVVVDRPASF